jgi:hypothetical protein
MARVFEAQYFGTCGACLEPIKPGDDVTYEDDELVHDDCANDVSWDD